MGPRFFGPTQAIKAAVLEHTFLLMYYIGFSEREAYNMPIWKRIWFLNRLKEELQRSKDAGSNASKSAQDNTPDQRFLRGNSRVQVPAKLRRFT